MQRVKTNCNSFPVMACAISGETTVIAITWANEGMPGVNIGPDVSAYLIRQMVVPRDTPARINQDLLEIFIIFLGLPLILRQVIYIPFFMIAMSLQRWLKLGGFVFRWWNHVDRNAGDVAFAAPSWNGRWIHGRLFGYCCARWSSLSGMDR